MSRRRLIRAAIVLVVSIVVGWGVLQLGTQIDWDAVRGALGRLVWWQLLTLVGLLLVRQILNATPTARFVPGLSRARAVLNDLSATSVATVTPPPADVVIRVAMFRTWGVDPVDGMAGVTLTTLVFYGARLLAPVLGLGIISFVGVERGQWIVASVSGMLAVMLLLGLILVVRFQGWAVILGRWGARTARALRRSADEDVWVSAVVSFRERVAATLRLHLLPALLALLGGIVVEGLILLASLRFVGVSGSTLSTFEILGGFLMAFPLTMLPVSGLGVLDAVLVSGWTTVVGEQHESVLLAGLIVWRAVSIGGALLLGALATAWWRRDARRFPPPPATTPSLPGDPEGPKA